jgi:hypothetical protein
MAILALFVFLNLIFSFIKNQNKMNKLTNSERLSKKEQGKREADTLLDYLHHTDILDLLFSGIGIAGSIALACDDAQLDNSDAQKIAQAARGIEFILKKIKFLSVGKV